MVDGSKWESVSRSVFVQGAVKMKWSFHSAEEKTVMEGKTRKQFQSYWDEKTFLTFKFKFKKQKEKVRDREEEKDAYTEIMGKGK